MIQMKKQILFGLIVLGLMQSCEKEIKFKDDDSKSLLVLNCIMKAGDSISVSLSKSFSTIGDQNVGDLTITTHASLKLIDETTGATFVTNQIGADNNYHFQAVAVAGHTYGIEVTHPDYPTASARLEFPQKIMISSWDTSQISIDQSQFSFQFNDPAGENYYGISRVMFDQTMESEYEVGFNVKGILNLEENYWYQNVLFSDDQLISSNPMIDLSFWFVQDTSSTGGTNTYTVRFSTISKELYLYAKSSVKIQENEYNPFAEPVRIYSNIENGYGIFAGYATDEVIVE
jgi:hypothetical protein